MAQQHSISNMSVKRYSDEDTAGVAPWENSSMPKFILQKRSFTFFMGSKRSFFFNQF